MDSDAGIYQIRNVRTGFIYIGESRTVRTRLRQHRSDLRRGRHDNHVLQAAWTLDGADAFRFEPVAFIGDAAVRRSVEEASIASVFGDRCYNAVISGPPNVAGIKRSPAHLAAISAAQRGNKHGLGNKMSVEHRAKLSALYKGKPRPPEVIAKMSATRTGKKYGPMSEAHRIAVSRARTGLRLSDEAKAARRARMIERGTWRGA